MGSCDMTPGIINSGELYKDFMASSTIPENPLHSPPKTRKVLQDGGQRCWFSCKQNTSSRRTLRFNLQPANSGLAQ